MHTRIRDDIFEALELADYEGAVRPGTCVRDVEMVSSFLGWELAAFLDEIAELRLSSFEFAGFVAWCDPVGDFVSLLIASVQHHEDRGVVSYHSCGGSGGECAIECTKMPSNLMDSQ